MLSHHICNWSIWFEYFTGCGWLQDTSTMMLRWHIFSRNDCHCAVQFFSYFFSKNSTQWWMIKEMQSVYKRLFTAILCVSWEVPEAKHIISITVHLFVLIQWASQQVSQPPSSSGSCGAVESTTEFCPAFCQRASTDTKRTDRSRERELPHVLSKLRSNCLCL